MMYLLDIVGLGRKGRASKKMINSNWETSQANLDINNLFDTKKIDFLITRCPVEHSCWSIVTMDRNHVKQFEDFMKVVFMGCLYIFADYTMLYKDAMRTA